MENFNFNEVDLNQENGNNGGSTTSGPRYIKLTNGADKVRTVKMIESSYGVTTKGEPYVRVVLEDKDGYITSNDYYVNTTVKEGNKTSSFNVSRTDFVKYLVVTGMTEEQAKNHLGEAKSYEDLATKLSVAIGKEFKMGFWGKIATSAKGEFLKTMFARGKNTIVPVSTPDKDVQWNNTKDETAKFEAQKQAKANGTATPKAVTDDLPF